jgi:hypothetical protein
MPNRPLRLCPAITEKSPRFKLVKGTEKRPRRNRRRVLARGQFTETHLVPALEHHDVG